MFSSYEKSEIIAGCSIYHNVTAAGQDERPQNDEWGQQKIFPEIRELSTHLKIPVSVYEEMPHFVLGYN